jgi:hypothetical protein
MKRLLSQLMAGFFVTCAIVACVSGDDPGAGDPLPSCNLYCTEIMKNCGGDRQQYENQSQCEKVCSLLDLGNPEDGEVNTIGCRLRRARSAATAEDCLAAGPFGGGVCGNRCQSYCQILGKHCPGVPGSPFEDQGSCAEACGRAPYVFDPNDIESSFTDSGKDNLNCRMHHLLLSLPTEVERAIHCPHGAVVSSVCNIK